jgi:hypothetical protein
MNKLKELKLAQKSKNFVTSYQILKTCLCSYSKPSLILLQLIRMSDNPDGNMKKEKCCS